MNSIMCDKAVQTEPEGSAEITIGIREVFSQPYTRLLAIRNRRNPRRTVIKRCKQTNVETDYFELLKTDKTIKEDITELAKLQAENQTANEEILEAKLAEQNAMAIEGILKAKSYEQSEPPPRESTKKNGAPTHQVYSAKTEGNYKYKKKHIRRLKSHNFKIVSNVVLKRDWRSIIMGKQAPEKPQEVKRPRILARNPNIEEAIKRKYSFTRVQAGIPRRKQSDAPDTQATPETITLI